MADVKTIDSYACGACGRSYTQREVAERCCTCSRCKLPVDKQKDFTGLHRGCSDLNEIERREARIAKAEKLENWDGPVVIDGDHYFQDLDEYVEYLADELEPGAEWPEWVHTCLIDDFPELGFQDLLENLVENHGLEDFSVDDIDVPGNVMDALEKACADFNAAAKASKYNKSWHENMTQVVRVPPRPAETA